MELPEFVSRQLSNPTGLGGRLIRRGMNRGNAAMNEEAVDRLGASAGDRVLDVGFGGGVIFELLLDRGVEAAGIDRSAHAVDAVEGSNRAAIEAGRLQVRRGEVESIPFEDESFDGVVTVNTVYFWPDLGAGLAEVLRVLKPGGRIVVAVRDGSVMKRVSRDIFTLRAPEEVLGAISAAGFVDGRIDTVGDGARHHLVATRP